MKLVWAGGSGRVRAAMEPPAEPPRGTVMSAEPDRCIHLWMTEFPGRSPLPPCPSSISIWVCSPHPRGTPAPYPQCTAAPSAAAADADTGDSAPAVGLTGVCPRTPLLPAEEPRTRLLTALGHRAGFPTAEPIDFWEHICNSFGAHHLGSSELNSA